MNMEAANFVCVSLVSFLTYISYRILSPFVLTFRMDDISGSKLHSWTFPQGAEVAKGAKSATSYQYHF
jgi:hypothetical protein